MKTVTLIRIAVLKPSPTNPRKIFRRLDELAASMRTAGVLSPILARPIKDAFECVFGERRVRAAKLAGLETIPAIISELTDSEVLQAQIIENNQREDVHPLEEADGYKALLDAEVLDAEELAAKLGKSKGYIYARLKLCTLCDEGREAFLADKLTASVALLIARLPTPELQREALTDLTNYSPDGEPVSYRHAADLLQREYLLRLAVAPFDRRSPTLVSCAGSCTECDKRTGTQRELFADLKSADACTDRKCWKSKVAAHQVALLETAKRRGLTILDGRAGERASYSSEYVRPTEKCCDDPRHRTYKQLLGKAGPDPVIVVRGEAVEECLPRKAVLQCLKASGHDFIDEGELEVAEPVIRVEPSKLEVKAQRAATAATIASLVGAAEAQAPTEAFWRLLAHAVLELAWSETWADVAKRRGLGTPKGHDALCALEQLIDKANVVTLRGLVLELVVTPRTYRAGGDPTGILAAACALFGITPAPEEPEAPAPQRRAAG